MDLELVLSGLADLSRRQREGENAIQGGNEGSACPSLPPHTGPAAPFVGLTAKWTHGVPCSKIIKNCKMASAEYSTK